MALALLLNQRSGKNSKPGKGENFGCKFTATFVLESSSVKPYGKLSGQLVIDSPAPLLHYGIRIQYEAICTLKFESKLDNRVRNHCKYGNILEGVENKGVVNGYMESPVMIDLEPLIKADANENRPYEMPAGTNTYGFTITMPGFMLPASFKNTYGSLFYKLAAYMSSENGVIVQIGEKVLKFGGYYNLSLNSAASRPAVLERSVKRSMFSGKKLVNVKLKVDSCGYLPEEVLRFTLEVQNPKCLPYKMSVQLLQKVAYAVDGTKKTTVAIVGSADKEVAEPESETSWDGSFKIHKMASATYVGKNAMYAVSHVVQFKVKLDDYSAIKADQTVFIGTTRESVEALSTAVNNINLVGGIMDNRLTERRGSNASSRSNASTNASSVSKPPTYSQLSSRMSSLETLPPGYDDMLEDNSKQCTIPENEPYPPEEGDMNANTRTS